MQCAGLTGQECGHEVQGDHLCRCCELVVEITDDLMKWVRGHLIHGPVRIHI